MEWDRVGPGQSETDKDRVGRSGSRTEQDQDGDRPGWIGTEKDRARWSKTRM